MDGWKKYQGKRVYVQLKSGREYSGVVIECEESFGTDAFLVLKDKFDNNVGFRVSEIKLIEVQSK